MIIIDSQKYGMRAEFSSLDEAQEAIRNCDSDGEFKGTVLYLRGDGIVEDWEGEKIGAEEERNNCNDAHNWRYCSPCNKFRCDVCGGPICQIQSRPINFATGSNGFACQKCQQTDEFLESEL